MSQQSGRVPAPRKARLIANAFPLTASATSQGSRKALFCQIGEAPPGEQ